MTDPIPQDPQPVIDAMLAAGWTRYGGRTGAYVRLMWPASQRTIIVPLEPGYADYNDLMGGALGELTRSADEGRYAQAALAAIVAFTSRPDTT